MWLCLDGEFECECDDREGEGVRKMLFDGDEVDGVDGSDEVRRKENGDRCGEDNTSEEHRRSGD